MTVPIDQPAAFDERELFFSVTDKKGRITSCNEVFIRISGFEPEDIIGAPHRVVRHPDMPKAVFRLLWDHLLADKPVGAYVKNLAKSGEYYWVYALAVPLDDGFLSIRLKPTSERLEMVKSLYSDMLAAEAEHGRDAEAAIAAGTAVLNDSLEALGVADYREFMTASLRDEVASRNVRLAARELARATDSRSRAVSAAFENLTLMDTLTEEAGVGAAHFDGVSLETHRIALNSAIAAARLSDAGAALGVLSGQIARLAQEIADQSEALDNARSIVVPACEGTSFQVAFASIVSEMITSFSEDAALEISLDEDQQRERFGDTLVGLRQTLDKVFHMARTSVGSGSAELRTSLVRFDEIAARLRRVLMTTRIGQVTGRAMAAGIDGANEYAELLTEFAQAGESGRERVDALQQSTAELSGAIRSWRSFTV